MEIRIQRGKYQDRFLFSTKKFPALIAGVGTGKTMCLLVKIYQYCEQYPKSNALICRREFVDLRDSTMRDFEEYFGVKVGSDKNYILPNGSKIMFRHGAEIGSHILKNINLAIAGIEQAEEFEDDTAFQFIRDRLRQRNGAESRPLCIIANASGHNWVWDLWINKAQNRFLVDKDTSQIEYINGEYYCVTATSFANAHNLPQEFVDDLRRKEHDAPSHYAQYVMNSFEEMEEDDYVFSWKELIASKELTVEPREGYGHKIIGYDIARYGNDKCASVGITQLGAIYWSVSYVDQWDHKDLDYTTGRILATSNSNHADHSIIDEDGLGSGPLDFIKVGRNRDDFRGFRNVAYSKDVNPDYANARTACAFKLKEMVSKGWIVISDELLLQELMTLRYKYTNDGRKILISKEEMRKKGIRSPNLADALMMAVSLVGEIRYDQDKQFVRMPNYSTEDNLFSIIGVR